MRTYTFIEATYGRIPFSSVDLASAKNSSVYGAQESMVQSLYGMFKVDKVFEAYI
ncbi:hypothetical protein [Sphingobacterium sp. FBM7-1]|uniref:hypothetical protein n=1 Tax=Sphingobacterium sp. FBM7-1 TaxID=2886688 RepID=UPI001D129447|nr:hypothetical protein [Sphingobacterium sp. FBM7-1]MCC2599782.1 hypothetical protein [Sphingobacterium sp. FBM7-1]